MQHRIRNALAKSAKFAHDAITRDNEVLYNARKALRTDKLIADTLGKERGEVDAMVKLQKEEALHRYLDSHPEKATSIAMQRARREQKDKKDVAITQTLKSAERAGENELLRYLRDNPEEVANIIQTELEAARGVDAETVKNLARRKMLRTRLTTAPVPVPAPIATPHPPSPPPAPRTGTRRDLTEGFDTDAALDRIMAESPAPSFASRFSATEHFADWPEGKDEYTKRLKLIRQSSPYKNLSGDALAATLPERQRQALEVVEMKRPSHVTRRSVDDVFPDIPSKPSRSEVPLKKPTSSSAKSGTKLHA